MTFLIVTAFFAYVFLAFATDKFLNAVRDFMLSEDTCFVEGRESFIERFLVVFYKKSFKLKDFRLLNYTYDNPIAYCRFILVSESGDYIHGSIAVDISKSGFLGNSNPELVFHSIHFRDHRKIILAPSVIEDIKSSLKIDLNLHERKIAQSYSDMLKAAA